MNFKNYNVSGMISGEQAQQVLVLTGVQNGTIIKSLQIITGNESCIVNVIRKGIDNNTYADIKLDLKANDYLVLWQGFFVIPYGHKLYIKADSNLCKVIANVVEL